MLTLSFASGWVGRGRRIGPTAQAAWTRKRTVRGAERCFFRRVGGTSASQRMRCAHTKSVPPAKKGLSDPVLDQRGPVAGLGADTPIDWGMAQNQGFSSLV